MGQDKVKVFCYREGITLKTATTIALYRPLKRALKKDILARSVIDEADIQRRRKSEIPGFTFAQNPVYLVHPFRKANLLRRFRYFIYSDLQGWTPPSGN
jgi:hypothetical protein